jgi:hypothetical protein
MAVSGHYLPDMLMRNTPSDGIPEPSRQANIELMNMLIHHKSKKRVTLVDVPRLTGVLDYLKEQRMSQTFKRAEKSVGAFDIPLTNPFEALSKPEVASEGGLASRVESSPGRSPQASAQTSSLAASSDITFPDVTADTLNFFPFDSEPGDMPGPSRRYMPGFLLDAAVFPSFDDTRVRDAITGMAPETRAAVLNGSLPYVPDTNFPGEPEEEDGDEDEEVAAL